MYSVKKLYKPSSLTEALSIMSEYPDAMPIAGGTDVIVKMRKNRPEDVILVSVGTIEDDEIKGVTKSSDGTVTIGAYTTFTEVAKSDIINEYYPMLKTAALSMGGPQIQNVATIGGNVCNGAVSADSAPSLFALDAKLVLRTKDSERTIPIAEFYLGPGKVDRKPGELLIKIIIESKGESFGGVYTKFATRKAMDLAVLGVAATVNLDSDGTIKNSSIALGVAAPVPVRCNQAESFLVGKKPSEKVLEEAGELALKDANPRDSWRASKRYREALIKELSSRAVEEAVELAGGRA